MRIIRTRRTTMRGAAMDELILRALVGGLLLAAMLGPLGSFVVWRRMAYFGDTIAHSALLGVALSLMSAGALPMTAAIFLVAISVAFILSRYARDTRFHADTLLGVLSHSALALGLVLVAMNREVQVDVNAFLFGDVLAMEWADVAVLAVLALMVAVVLARQWRALLMTTIDPAIAQVEGINTTRQQFILTVLLAAVIAVAIKITGILLITALLVIPAAAARTLAKTPAQMAWMASVLGMASVCGGLLLSLECDAPSGPMMVVLAALIFVACALVKRR
jgi:zinc transport system permease protein